MDETAYNRNMGDVDVIFAGGGAAACVAAGRLAKTAPNLKILIIERGRNNIDDPMVVNSALAMAHLAPNSTTALFYRSKPSEHVGGREVVVPAGGLLGGGSSINLGMYTRAQPEDYDRWNTSGWTANDMIPLCNKTETYHSTSTESRAQQQVNMHGSCGPIHISDGGFMSHSRDAILETVVKMGMKNVEDINDFHTTSGFMRLPRYVSPDGKRQDAAHCYIHPLFKNGAPTNLRILYCSTVTRVLFDKAVSPPKAIGVQYRSTESKDGIEQAVYASKLVVVSSGALGSPQILERSGVGNETILRDLGIRVISSLPRVGENYQDHHNLTSVYKTRLAPEETLDGFALRRKDVAAAIQAGDPQLRWNSIDVGGKLRPSDEEARALGPAFYDLWQKDWAPHPNKPMVIMAFINVFAGDPAETETDRQYLTIGTISLYPYSRGSIHITDASATTDGCCYDFASGFLGNDADVKMQVWAYKKARAIARQLPFYAGEVAGTHPRYSPGSDSSKTEGKVPAYSAEDDAAIEEWIRRTIATTWHSMGTCAMRPRQEGGVVDARLDVYGTQSLKVADMSIVPENVGANVGNTAFAIGEKVALLIAEELVREM